MTVFLNLYSFYICAGAILHISYEFYYNKINCFNASFVLGSVPLLQIRYNKGTYPKFRYNEGRSTTRTAVPLLLFLLDDEWKLLFLFLSGF